MKILRKVSYYYGLTLLLSVLAMPIALQANTIDYHSFTLENGMEVVLVPNHKVPAVAHMVWYKVGSADEVEGKTGLAHLFEHLMFKATKNMESGAFSEAVAKVGGNDNAFTHYDYTGYYQNIARDKLEMVMQKEADRMINLILNEEQLQREKLVVLEERRSRIENSPTALLREKMNAVLFKSHPYGRPIIGFQRDVQSSTLEDTKQFYRTYYAPNNAVLIVVGDITLKELKSLAKKYYGVLPTNKNIPTRNIPKQIKRGQHELVFHYDKKVKTPRWYRSYVAPQYGEGCKECYALTLLSYLLGEAHTSKLYKRLVVDKKIAASVGSYYNDLMIGPAKFSLTVTPVKNVKLNVVESEVENILEEIKTTEFSSEEIMRAKKMMSAQIIYAQEDFSNMANIFGVVYANDFDGEYINSWEKNIQDVTAKDIMRVAQKIFSDHASVTGKLLPRKEKK